MPASVWGLASLGLEEQLPTLSSREVHECLLEALVSRDSWASGSPTTCSFLVLRNVFRKLESCFFSNLPGSITYSLEKSMAPHSSTLAWQIPWTEGPGRLQPMASLRVRHNWGTSLSLSTFMHWRRKWQPTPVFLPGESHGRRSLVGCSPWGRTELDTTEVTWQHYLLLIYRHFQLSMEYRKPHLRRQIVGKLMHCMFLLLRIQCQFLDLVLKILQSGLHFSAHLFISVQSLSRVQLLATPWTAAFQASLSITNSWSLLRLMSIESLMPSKHLILYCPLLLLLSIFPSMRVFSNESVLCIRWPEYWSVRFSISPSNESSGLISFRMDWLDLLAVQGTLKSVLQHCSLKASILLHAGLMFSLPPW